MRKIYFRPGIYSRELGEAVIFVGMGMDFTAMVSRSDGCHIEFDDDNFRLFIGTKQYLDIPRIKPETEVSGMYDDRCENHFMNGEKIYDRWEDCCVSGKKSKKEVFKMSNRIVIAKVENGFVYMPIDSSPVTPVIVDGEIKQWISGNDVAEIGRTVLKIFGANPEKTLTPKSEG